MNNAQTELIEYPAGKTGAYAVPASVTRIGDNAFRGSAKLTADTIPDGVTAIGSSAFDGCTGLEDVYYLGSAEQWEEISIGDWNDPLTDANFYYTGPCGTNLTWTLDAATGALTITGAGDMTDYSVNSAAPWGTDITEVTIASGVTGIGDCAFRNCGSLTGISIPGTVTSIGNGRSRSATIWKASRCRRI